MASMVCGVRRVVAGMAASVLVGAVSMGASAQGAVAVPPRLAAPIEVDGERLAVPTPAQAAWQALEVGMFIHIAPQTWQDSEWDNLQTPASAMDPAKLDTDQWVRVAESMGAMYIVFVAKHEGGFCWWPTKTTEYCVRNAAWRGGKGDVLADLSASCKKRGMKLGVYLSPQDKTHAVGVGGKAKDPAKQGEYERIFREQLTEVLTGYGEVMEVWFDGSLVFDVGDILEKHAPNAVVFQGPQATIRWVGNEDGEAPYPAWNAVDSTKKKWGDYVGDNGDPKGDRWLPNECDARLRATWFWRTDNEKTIKSLEKLVEMYEASVGRGGVLLLNNTPDRSGLIPEADAARCREFGEAIRATYGTAISRTSGKGRELVTQPSAPVEIDRIVIQEDIAGAAGEGGGGGERVRKYEVDGLIDGTWKTIARGQSVGHKRIERLSEPVRVEAVRLRVLESVGEPAITNLSLHRLRGVAR